jgi:hypothetical protein
MMSKDRIESRVCSSSSHHSIVLSRNVQFIKSDVFYHEYCIIRDDNDFCTGGVIEIQIVHQVRMAAPFQNIVWLFGCESFVPSSSSKDRSRLDKTRPNKLIQIYNNSISPPCARFFEISAKQIIAELIGLFRKSFAIAIILNVQHRLSGNMGMAECVNRSYQKKAKLKGK